MRQDRPDRAGHLVGLCHDRYIHRPPLPDLLKPRPRLLRVEEHTARTVNQQLAQIRIASLADPQQLDLAARARLSRDQPDPGRELTPGSERLRVSHRPDRSVCSYQSDARSPSNSPAPLALLPPALSPPSLFVNVPPHPP